MGCNASDAESDHQENKEKSSIVPKEPTQTKPSDYTAQKVQISDYDYTYTCSGSEDEN